MIKGGVEIAVTLIIIRVIMFIHVGSSVPPQTQRSLNRKILGLCRKQTVFINYIQYCSVVMSVECVKSLVCMSDQLFILTSILIFHLQS